MRRKMLFRLYGFILILILLLSGVIYLFRAEFMRIQNVEVVGATDENKINVVALAEETFKGNKFLFIPNNQALFYSAASLQEKILNQLKSVQDVRIDIAFPKTLRVEIKERAPESLYCADTCYFIDAKGIIYEKAPSFSEGVYVMYRDPNRATSTDPLGTSVASEEAFTLAKKYIDYLPVLGLTPTTVSFTTKNEIKIELRGNGYILINLDREYNETIQNITTVIQEGVKEFEYIDVRFGNKIYYKERMI
jgi:cell division septal protein FtsQ